MDGILLQKRNVNIDNYAHFSTLKKRAKMAMITSIVRRGVGRMSFSSHSFYSHPMYVRIHTWRWNGPFKRGRTLFCSKRYKNHRLRSLCGGAEFSALHLCGHLSRIQRICIRLQLVNVCNTFFCKDWDGSHVRIYYVKMDRLRC